MENGNGRDPYVSLWRQMRAAGAQCAPPGMCLGTVTQIDTVVLQIRTDAGLILSGEDLLVNPALLWDAKEEAAATLNVGQDVACKIEFTVGMETVTVERMKLYTLPGTMQTQSRRLKKGERVLMQPSRDGQVYYVLCKVVGI